MEVDTALSDRIHCQLGTLSRSDGSSEFTNNDTSVIVSVNGPMEVKMSKENIEKATVELLYKQKTGLPSCAERALEGHLKSVCENVILTGDHPRSSITIVIQEVHNNGSLLAACINAISLALLDASLPMNSVVVATSCMIDNDGKLITNPTEEQEQDAKSDFTLVFENKDWEIVTSHCKGRFTRDEYMRAVKKCRKEGKLIYAFMEEMLKKKFAKYL